MQRFPQCVNFHKFKTKKKRKFSANSRSALLGWDITTQHNATQHIRTKQRNYLKYVWTAVSEWNVFETLSVDEYTMWFDRKDEHTQRERDSYRSQWKQTNAMIRNDSNSMPVRHRISVEMFVWISLIYHTNKAAIFLRSHIRFSYAHTNIDTNTRSISEQYSTARHSTRLNHLKSWKMESRKSHHKRCWKSPEFRIIDRIPNLHHNIYARAPLSFKSLYYFDYFLCSPRFKPEAHFCFFVVQHSKF